MSIIPPLTRIRMNKKIKHLLKAHDQASKFRVTKQPTVKLLKDIYRKCADSIAFTRGIWKSIRAITDPKGRSVSPHSDVTLAGKMKTVGFQS